MQGSSAGPIEAATPLRKPLKRWVGAALLAAGLLASPALGQLRVVNYNIANLRGDPVALENVIAALHDDDKPGFAVPVSLFMFQEVHTGDVAPLQTIINAAAPPGVTYILGTYTGSVSEDNSGGAQCMFYRQGTLAEFTSSHIDIFTQAGRNADRWRMQLFGYTQSTAWFYIYSAHLKASSGAANEADRLTGVTAIRTNADLLGQGAHVIYAGDQNFYSNAETGYVKYLSVGNGQAVDPYGSGVWSGVGNAIKHSQSPIFMAFNGLVGGGMDDRFDFQLSTAEFHDNMGLSLLSCRTLGNDGLHYNLAINNGNNSYYPGDVPRSNAVADNLAFASDHCPIVCDYKIPAIMSASAPANYGRVIQNAAFSVMLTVQNTANVVVVQGADILTYTANGAQNLSGTFNDTVTALGDTSTALFPLNTSATGVRPGQFLCTSSSQGVQNPAVTVNTTGSVVRASNASFSNVADENALTLPLAYDADTGIQNIAVDVHNFGFDSLQALLDVDSVSARSAPFAYIGGAALGVGATPATLNFTFNTAGLSPGPYNANVTINVSDENIPGAASSNISLTLAVSINTSEPCDADITGNGWVNVDDLLAVINAWGRCAGCPADIDNNNFVNVDDLLAVINAWGMCP